MKEKDTRCLQRGHEDIKKSGGTNRTLRLPEANTRDKDTKCLQRDDNHKYCVRHSKSHRTVRAFNLLDKVNMKIVSFIELLNFKYHKEPNIKRLVSGYKKEVLYEILPQSPHVAYVKNKGDKLALCLQVEKHESKFVDINTLMFVTLHEISHIASKSMGHTNEFRKNFRFILDEAVKARIYEPEDYSKSPVRYCGMMIKHNPYFDIKINSES